MGNLLKLVDVIRSPVSTVLQPVGVIILLGDLYLSSAQFKWFPRVVIWRKILTTIMLSPSKLFGASDVLIKYIGWSSNGQSTPARPEDEKLNL